ncbi:MAG: hypothetical protein EWV55_11020 [Microcystis viridis Mv_BB_P_19951000_S69]|jgi:hypothetical protein|uniref:Uncharacterized protein n=1 Tax=Microcystis viridis Mv_BB_P_19951000_S68D TaxID=2486270 RepID=A0A552HZK0_MICVR|nr:MAG: hypothetical protein EWV55_11020 [Microcystis viridis Mv_BB_P_19951000_S69]TRU75032.1 MAG: hypothetical protein EWV47_09360 [Microcystis viridis Mv_BB_P_19951000_S68]TRU76657.1 MAG: hypothetical protein EWV77_06825 [Microcystis viridis Mv_BB_P_19951000_S68D]TRU80489.1 MAG: hypothetical protein EWV46_23350 [Microcystis viridis Mv_BB_P_19951000_S69D]
MKRAIKWIGGILGVLVLVVVSAFAWFAYSFLESLEPIESIDQHQEVLAYWKACGPGLVDHFPSSVPASARNVKFSSFPGFLQGGGHVQLRMELPEAEAKKLFEHATKTAKQHRDGGNPVSGPSPHTLAKDAYEFPADYRIFIFHAEPYKEGSGHDWNHGESKGMVVSLQRNEVLYYAEQW